MALGEFLWCDLATFNVANTLDYYKSLFDWDLKLEEFNDGSLYYYASTSNDVTAGIYEMPSVYRDQGMPSFWMSYIGVDDIMTSIADAERMGGKLLLGPATFGSGATIAMIADPHGARFTFFSGSHLQPRSTKMLPGAHFWNELYSPEPEASTRFYSELFGWKVAGPDQNGRRLVYNMAGSLNSVICDGSKEKAPLNQPQWTVSFACENLARFADTLATVQDKKVRRVSNANSTAVCVTDPNGAVFFVTEAVEQSRWF